MSILVINSGSTSIRAALLETADGPRVARMKISRLGTGEAVFQLDDETPVPCPPSHAESLEACLPQLLKKSSQEVRMVGHRVVHGGSQFKRPVIVNEDVLNAIEELASLAPLHNPANAAGIHTARRLLPGVLHVAVFDTAFHNTISRRASTYAIPSDVAEAHQIRRFGFHGTSHQFVADRTAAFLKQRLRQLRIISCHLGGGCSVCAVEYGRSVETSME